MPFAYTKKGKHMKFLRYASFILLVAFAAHLVAGTQSDLAQNAVVRTLADLPGATGGVSMDRQGNIYVADIGAAPGRRGTTVYKVTPQGGVSVFAQDANLLGASGNAFDSKGNFYQSSLQLNHVTKISPEGDVSIFVSQGIRGPVGLVFDKQDTMYVANCIGRTIQKVTPEGESALFAFSNLFNCPNGIAIDEDENIYVANINDGRVLKVTPDGTVTLFVNVPGNGNGHITYADGFFYMVSRSGARIYTLSLDGELELLAGTGQRGHDDGPSLEATFSLPNDLGISPDGNILYINEAIPTSGSLNQPSQVRMIVLNP